MFSETATSLKKLFSVIRKIPPSDLRTIRLADETLDSIRTLIESASTAITDLSLGTFQQNSQQLAEFSASYMNHLTSSSLPANKKLELSIPATTVAHPTSRSPSLSSNSSSPATGDGFALQSILKALLKETCSDFACVYVQFPDGNGNRGDFDMAVAVGSVPIGSPLPPRIVHSRIGLIGSIYNSRLVVSHCSRTRGVDQVLPKDVLMSPECSSDLGTNTFWKDVPYAQSGIGLPCCETRMGESVNAVLMLCRCTPVQYGEYEEWSTVVSSKLLSHLLHNFGLRGRPSNLEFEKLITLKQSKTFFSNVSYITPPTTFQALREHGTENVVASKAMEIRALIDSLENDLKALQKQTDTYQQENTRLKEKILQVEKEITKTKHQSVLRRVVQMTAHSKSGGNSPQDRSIHKSNSSIDMSNKYDMGASKSQAMNTDESCFHQIPTKTLATQTELLCPSVHQSIQEYLQFANDGNSKYSRLMTCATKCTVKYQETMRMPTPRPSSITPRPPPTASTRPLTEAKEKQPTPPTDLDTLQPPKTARAPSRMGSDNGSFNPPTTSFVDLSSRIDFPNRTATRTVRQSNPRIMK